MKAALAARTFKACGTPVAAARATETNMTMARSGTPMAMDLVRAMGDADYVLIDGIIFESAYLGPPDSDAVADDIVLEARHGDTELAFTRSEMDGAEHLGEGIYRLKSGALLRFLSSATVH